MLEFLIIAGLAYFLWPKGSKSPSGGPIVTIGSRSPMYYDIMEDSYADYKAKLIEDAKNGVIYQRSESINFKDWLENKTPPVYHDYPATEALKDFLEYERNGYM